MKANYETVSGSSEGVFGDRAEGRQGAVGGQDGGGPGQLGEAVGAPAARQGWAAGVTSVFVGLLFVGCGGDFSPRSANPNIGETLAADGLLTYRIVRVDGCEYIQVNPAYANLPLTHKGNCTNHVGILQ